MMILEYFLPPRTPPHRNIVLVLAVVVSAFQEEVEVQAALAMPAATATIPAKCQTLYKGVPPILLVSRLQFTPSRNRRLTALEQKM